MEIKIGDKTIENNSNVYIIAEIGVNHNGSFDLAKKLIYLAKNSGADAVKFQMFQTEEMVSDHAELAEYQKNKEYTTQKEMLRKLELSEQQFRDLKSFSDNIGITFLSTPFDLKSAFILNEMGVEAFKVGSGDLTNLPLLNQLANYQKPIILSSGMATLGEIENTLSNIPESVKIALLHCTSSYPAPFEDLNLKAINTLKYAFNKIIGYSDHSLGLEVPFAITSMGYKILEKHLTLDNNLPGPDHLTSLEPKEFANMVAGIRNIEKALGHSLKRLAPSEKLTKPLVRKGIYLKKDLEVGHELKLNDLTYLRPINEIEANKYMDVIGKKLSVSKEKGQPLFWRDIR